MIRPRVTSRAFTILEVMVVVVILGMLATLIVPRFSGMGRRKFNLIASEVADMLTMYAQREQLQQQTVGLQWDGERGEIQFLVLHRGDNGLGGSGSVEWRIDPYVKPVYLPEDILLLEVTADGDYVDIGEFPLTSSPMEPRPTIAIVLQGPRDTVTITLAAHAIVPEVTTDGRRYAHVDPGVDLDGAGRGREDW